MAGIIQSISRTVFVVFALNAFLRPESTRAFVLQHDLAIFAIAGGLFCFSYPSGRSDERTTMTHAEAEEPLTYADALKWAKNHDPALYEEMRAPFVAAFAKYAAEMLAYKDAEELIKEHE
jgi:hypothetical protein